MKKVWVIPIMILVAVVLAGGAFFYLRSKNTVLVISPAVDIKTASTVTPTPVPFDLTTWKDEAGFSFQYPKDLLVNKHEEDQDNYAHVELTSKNHPGSIIVWAKDLPAKVTDLESWVKLPAFAGATVLDTMLGGQSAKKILESSATAKMVSVGTISDSLLFSVDGTLTDNEYWSRVHDTITNSFSFTDGSTATAATQGSSGGGAVDEEEVVQ